MNYWDAAHIKIEKVLGDIRREVFYSTGKSIDEIAVEGNVRFVSEYDPFWGADGADYSSEIMQSPTWLEVAVRANDMINTTKDFHHRFLEKVYYVSEGEDGELIYRFGMGS